MKKLIFVVLVLLFAVNFSQAQKSPITHEYKGVVKLSGTLAPNGLNLVDNAYKQHMLYKKTKEWLNSEYGKTAQFKSKDDSVITYFDKDFILVLNFKDGVFMFTFTDKGNMTDKQEQAIIDRLVSWIKTKPLADLSW